jgi:O-antigen/teichoic acid export membrane protein
LENKENSRATKVIALSLGQTFTTLVLLISGMFATRMLTKSDYATLRQTFIAYNFIAPLLMLGLPNALYYFLPRTENRKKTIAIENMIMLGLLSILFALFMALGGYKYLALRFNNPELVHTLKWMIGYPLYVMPVAILSAVLVIQGKTILLSSYNVISSIILLAGTIAGLYITHSYSGPLLAQIFLPLLFFPVAFILIWKNAPGEIGIPNRSSMVSMLKYAAPLGLATMMGSLMLQLDKIIVSWMCSPEEFANYVNGAMEIPLIGVITGSISTVLLSDMSTLCYQDKRQEAMLLFRKATQYSAAVLLPVMAFLALTAKPFIVTLYSEKYVESTIPFLIFLLIIPIRTVMYGSALMAIGKSKVILYRSFFDLLINLVLSIILIYFIGYLGAAVATVVTLYGWTVPYNLYHISKGFKVPAGKVLPFPELGKILLISFLTLLPASVYLLTIKFLAPVFQVILAASIYFPLVFILLYRKKHIFIPKKFEKFIPASLKN